MELTKEEMKKVIKWLEDYYVLSDYKPEDFPDDIDGLPAITRDLTHRDDGNDTCCWCLKRRFSLISITQEEKTNG